MGEVDHPRLRADPGDHPMTDADELVARDRSRTGSDHRRARQRPSVPRRRPAPRQPVDVVRAASTSGSRPRSRSASLVTGPMLTQAGRRRQPRPGRVEEEADRRGGREGHVVGGGDARRAARPAAARRPSRRAPATSTSAPRARSASGRTSRASAARATSARVTGTSASASTSPSATNRSGTTSAITPCSRSARAVPGPIAATARRPSARASRPAAAQPLEQQRDAVGAGQADEVVAAQLGRGTVERHDPDRRRLDDLGAERAQPRGQPAGLRPRAGDGDGHGRPAAGPRARRAVAQRRHRAEHARSPARGSRRRAGLGGDRRERRR